MSNLISFGAASALSALAASVLAFMFVLYYSYALNLPNVEELIIVLVIVILPTIVIQGTYFGMFHPFGFSGLPPMIRLMNRSMIRGKTWFEVTISPALNADQMRNLFRKVCYLPRENATVAAVMIALIAASVFSYIILKFHYSLKQLFQVGVIAGIGAILHAGFTALITELITGEMRSRIKRTMHERNIDFTEIPLSRVRSKIIFFIMILVTTLFISNFLVYHNVAFAVMVRFSIFAIIISVIMASMLFAIIFQSLKEIEAASESLKRGEDANLFPESLDHEFINVATGLISATTQIRDYQHNLERKVRERTAELQEANSALHAKDKLIQMELDFACEIQKGIIPATIDEWNGLRFFGYYKPMEKVSGDYYDVFPAQGNRLGVLMADVSGHGVPAALITTMAKVAFARAAQNTHSPAQTFREVNDQLTKIVTTQDYLTAFYLTIDETHHFFFGNASHQHGKILRAKDGSIENLDTGGLFVGAMSDAGDSYDEKESRLFAGDRLLLYTDGVIEIRNPIGEEFGIERFDLVLQESAALPPTEILPKIISEIYRFSENTPANDDISLLMIEVNKDYSHFLQMVAGAYQKIELGELIDAAQILDEAIVIYGKNLLSLKTAGVLNYDLRRFDAAEKYLNRYIALNRQNAEVFYYLSSVAIQKKNFLQAEEMAREAIALRSNYALAFNNLSIACLNLEKFALARFAIDKALGFDPENHEIIQNSKKLTELLEKSK